MNILISRWTFIIYTCCFLFHDILHAQENRISGRVMDTETWTPVTGAHIFLDNTLIGTVSDDNGNFILENLPNGKYRLVISFVGYRTEESEIFFPQDAGNYYNVNLEYEPLQLDEVIVSPQEWEQNLERFKTLFIGETKNSSHTELLNTEVLDFEIGEGVFKATAREPLEIINHALGYEITVTLDSLRFGGLLNSRSKDVLSIHSASFFREMEPKDHSELERWRRERARAYLGSFRHFLDSVISNTHQEEGFKCYFMTTSRGINSRSFRLVEIAPDELIRNHPQYENLIIFEVPEKYQQTPLQIDYNHAPPEEELARVKNIPPNTTVQTSYLELPQGIAILSKETGAGIEPFVPYFSGYWAWTSLIPDRIPLEIDL